MWEYKRVELKSLYSLYWMDHFEEVANKYGRSGWEMISYDHDTTNMIFKRFKDIS